MMSTICDDWPDDADGDVFRRLRDKGFDFSKQYVVDFVVDFEDWPPNPEALRKVQREFPSATEYIDDFSGTGTFVVKIEAQVSYQLVVDTQQRLTTLVSDFGGWCDSWGVLH